MSTQTIAAQPEPVEQPESKIWSCPLGCGYNIADGPVPDGEPSRRYGFSDTALDRIQEHLEEHDQGHDAGTLELIHKAIVDDQPEPAPLPKRTGRELSTVAANLVRVAADLDDLANLSENLGGPLTGGATLYLHPDYGADETTRVALVDALSRAVLGRDAKDQEMSSGSWQHAADGARGPITVSVLTGIADPTKRDALAEKDAEIERLRAELANAHSYLLGDAPARGTVRHMDVTNGTQPAGYEFSTVVVPS
jgi:hypothetical protein